MSGRSLLGLSFRTFAPLCGLSLWAACSTEPTDFFGAPNSPAGTSNAGAGGSVAGSGSDQSGTGGTQAGSGGDVGGTGTKGGSGGNPTVGGSSNPGGGTTNNGGAGGTTAAMGGSGQGGSLPDAGMSGESGAGENGMGGTAVGGEAGTPGGMAGESGAGTGGTGGSAAGNGGTGGTGGTGGSAAGNGGTGGQPGCTDDDGCSDSQYCKKSTCDAPTGVCTARATACTGSNATFSPVCGCDHMTYYTLCVAAREGVNVAASGECSSGTAATCSRNAGSGDSCQPHRDRAACYRTRDACNASPAPDEGVCWVLPESCPDEDENQRDCNNGSPLCRGLCDALENKRPIIRDACN
jgi:hypothetical protein